MTEMTRTPVVDSHAHVFSDPLDLLSFLSVNQKDQLGQFRNLARQWLKPLSKTLHQAQTSYRHLPPFARDQIDQLGGLLPLPGLLLESSPHDLTAAMKEAEVDVAWIIAHPHQIPNEWILEIAQENPQWVPVVNIPKGTSKPGLLLKSYVEKGAKALKIHASADGEGSNSPRYRALLRAASELNLPVILHSGCIHSHLLYKKPNEGNPENFVRWYEAYPETQFILAHMNFHEPDVALDLCEEYPNLWVDTSWQPSEVIGEAVRRIGANRILFGSDWPFVGNNMKICRSRVEDGVETGLLNAEQARLILGENAVKLLGLKPHAD